MRAEPGAGPLGRPGEPIGKPAGHRASRRFGRSGGLWHGDRMARFLPAGVRRTLVVFATFAGLLLSMAQACGTDCGSSSGSSSRSRSTATAPRSTVTPSETSSGARYFQDRQRGTDSTRKTTTTNRNDGTCTPTSRATTTKNTSTKSTHTGSGDKKDKNNGSAFDDGYDKGYDEGYDDGYDDAHREDTGKSRHDDN